MLNPVSRELNLNNLALVFDVLQGIDAFIFFGTLLGYVREGNIIEYDDDIDVYVNATDLNPLLTALEGSGFNVNVLPIRKKWYHRQKPPLIVQATRLQDGVETYADFYLYDDVPADYLLEKWNFKGAWKDPATALHVPKDLVFPLKDAEMQGIAIRVPAQPEALCEFLYGPSWSTPVRKSEGYVMEIVNHTPVFRPKS
ncbi:MAG: LicD family protein [Tateyamaria sp.]|uniref:LicD family protein n=1 Tax=Tateyamaria sp. TaxID=1929288 RepID=UPI003290F2DA